MIIYYPEYVTWKITLNKGNSVTDYFSKEKVKRFYKSTQLLKQNGYKLQMFDLDNDFINQFAPIYTNHISTKANPYIFPIKQILSQRMQQNNYKSISLYHDQTLLGAMIFRVSPPQSLSIAYRAFPHTLDIKHL